LYLYWNCEHPAAVSATTLVHRCGILSLLAGAVKTVFNKTGNRFVETGYLPVIGLLDIMCHVAAILEGRQLAK